ncbi:unnamed protein product, partial [Musa hybrid cultivar]
VVCRSLLLPDSFAFQISAVTLDEEHQGRCGSHKDLSAAGWDDPKDGINSD